MVSLVSRNARQSWSDGGAWETSVEALGGGGFSACGALDGRLARGVFFLFALFLALTRCLNKSAVHDEAVLWLVPPALLQASCFRFLFFLPLFSLFQISIVLSAF